MNLMSFKLKFCQFGMEDETAKHKEFFSISFSMKHFLLILSILFFNISFAQNDVELTIINDTIKKVSKFDNCNIVYTLKNVSNKNYLIILDDDEFNEDGDNFVEPRFLGLPDYNVYEKNILLESEYAFHNGQNKFDLDKSSPDFKKFRKSFPEIFSDADLEIAFRISKNIITLKPGEEKYFSTKINFPSYKSRYLNMKNKSEYYFQISLQSPKDIVEKYYQPIKEKNNKEIVFVGQIFSKKIPLVYEVYNEDK